MTDQNNKGTGSHSSGGGPPVLSSRSHEADLPPSRGDHQYADKKGPSAFEIAKFVVEIMAFIALVVYAAITYCMWEATKDAADAATAGAAAATEAAKAALKANRLAAAGIREQHEATVLEHRAWLLVASATASKMDVFKTGGADIRFRVQNIGKAPAFNIRADFRWLPIGMECPLDEVALPGALAPMPQLIPNLVLSAGDSTSDMPSTLFGVFSKQDSINIVTGVSSVFLFGLIQYDDVIGINRSTRYCARYEPVKNDSFIPVKVTFK